MKDMRKYKNLPKFMENNRHVLDVYPRLLTQASQAWFRVDGVDKRTKENEIMSSFRRSRKVTGLLGDAFKLMRVWR
jgi:electron transfer flavoprotein-quinone oxidoreductase